MGVFTKRNVLWQGGQHDALESEPALYVNPVDTEKDVSPWSQHGSHHNLRLSILREVNPCSPDPKLHIKQRSPVKCNYYIRSFIGFISQ